jgi:ketosteroid isomerase-like protein
VSDDNKQLLRQIFAELAAGNSRPMVERLAPDVAWTVMGRTPWSRTYRGKQAVLGELLGELRARLADRYRATAERLIAEGDLVVVEARGHATTTAGLPYDNQYCFIYRIRDGAIQEVTEYLDTELVTAALGPA